MTVTTQTKLIPDGLPNPASPQFAYQEITANGAITIPSGCVVINGTTITATLAAPRHDGQVLFISSENASAHIIDLATSGISGGSGDEGTFGGAVGDGVTLFSKGDHWYQSGNVNVTWA
jgi:hypothetical protein